MTETNPTVFGAFRLTKHGDKQFLTFIFSKNKMFTKYFQQVTELKEQGLTEQVQAFLTQCSTLFKQKVVNMDFFALCYLTQDNKDQRFYQMVKQAI